MLNERTFFTYFLSFSAVFVINLELLPHNQIGAALFPVLPFWCILLFAFSRVYKERKDFVYAILDKKKGELVYAAQDWVKLNPWPWPTRYLVIQYREAFGFVHVFGPIPQAGISSPFAVRISVTVSRADERFSNYLLVNKRNAEEELKEAARVALAELFQDVSKPAFNPLCLNGMQKLKNDLSHEINKKLLFGVSVKQVLVEIER